MGLENWNTLEELQEQIALRSSDPSDLYGKIKDKLIYSSYAEDRIECLTEIWDEELYADCISAQGYINQQVKNLDDKTSEEETGTLVHHLDRLADYILRASFDNEEDREQYEKLKIEKAKARKISDYDQKKKQELKIRDIQKTRSGLLSNNRKPQTGFAHINIENMKEEGERYDVSAEKKSSTHFTFKDKELNQDGRFKNNRRYWEHYGQHFHDAHHSLFKRVDHSIKYPEFAYSDIRNREEDLWVLEYQINHLPESKKRKELENFKRELTQELNISTDLFRKPMSFKPSKLKMDVDPLLAIERRITYTDKNIIKELIYNYAEIKTVYQNRTSSVLWCAVQDMDKMLNTLKISSIQQFILGCVYNNNNWTLKEIKEELLRDHSKEISVQGVLYHIDKYIDKVTEYYIKKELNK